MKVYIISDTHGFHKQLKIPDGIDLMIHCGDASNNRVPSLNYNELADFFDWYKEVNIKHKIYSPGNHDTSMESGMFKNYDWGDIKCIIHNTVEIEGRKIFCSPYTPSFGNWAYMRKRENLNKYWVDIPEGLDMLITHGPPKAILDLSENRDREIEYCGDSALMKRVEKVQPKYMTFGHIHDYQMHRNYGIRTVDDLRTTFINASMVEDGRFDKGLIHNGHVIKI